MLRFLLKRILWTILTLWVVYTLSFFLMRAAPGGPFAREKQIPEAIKRNIEARYRMDQHLIVQYFDGLGRIAFGSRRAGSMVPEVWPDFGPSLRLEDYTVNELIAQGFPVSATLAVFGLVFAVTLGLTAGVVSAIRAHSIYDAGMIVLATIGIAVPNFALAAVAIIVFSFMIPVAPVAGWGELRQVFMPSLCLGAPLAAYIARLSRAGMLEVLNRDYIRTAQAKGLSERAVVIRHALKGAILPVVTFLGPATAGILTGSVVLEQIFLLPGMASHFIEGAFQRDYPLLMGVVLVYAFLLCVMNAIVDLSYAIIDPRVKIE